jgi:hypothetical protein
LRQNADTPVADKRGDDAFISSPFHPPQSRVVTKRWHDFARLQSQKEENKEEDGEDLDIMAMEFHDVKTFEGQRFDNNKVNLLSELQIHPACDRANLVPHRATTLLDLSRAYCVGFPPRPDNNL